MQCPHCGSASITGRRGVPGEFTGTRRGKSYAVRQQSPAVAGTALPARTKR